jgi:hypothetical protein
MLHSCSTGDMQQRGHKQFDQVTPSSGVGSKAIWVRPFSRLLVWGPTVLNMIRGAVRGHSDNINWPPNCPINRPPWDAPRGHDECIYYLIHLSLSLDFMGLRIFTPSHLFYFHRIWGSSLRTWIPKFGTYHVLSLKKHPYDATQKS